MFAISRKCALGWGLVLAVQLPVGAYAASSERVLYAFQGGNDGSAPWAGLIMDGSDNLYGTTSAGGENCRASGGNGCGTVFRLAPNGKSWTETVLYAFKGRKRGDGRRPYGGLVRDGSGNLFGTTESGGTHNEGTVFRLAADGKETVLYSFDDNKHGDGHHPYAGPILDSSGNLYGTTVRGGKAGAGTVFALSPDGTETIRYSFSGGADAAFPFGGLVADSQGNLYGTTAGKCRDGCGTVFELAPDGTETVLHTFAGGPNDAGEPEASLIMDSSGNLYGTTAIGGANYSGAVFRIAADGSETVLYSFCAKKYCSDGYYPYDGLVRDSAGNLYGTTFGAAASDGSSYYGAVFKLAPDGTETVLHAFAASGDGGDPYAGLILDNAGNLYGTTSEGGIVNNGTVFEVTSK